MKSARKRIGSHWWSLLLGLSVAFSAVDATCQAMKVACTYESAKLSDTATEKGYAIDCRNRTDDRCPSPRYVLDANWKVQGDESILTQTAVSGLGEKSTQITTVNRKTLKFAFRWEMPSKDRPPPILTGEGSCVVEK
jgi:hypothetical protein